MVNSLCLISRNFVHFFNFIAMKLNISDRVNHVLEFTVAERLLLGAQFRKEEINPLDYIYQAIGCHIDVISSKDTNVVPHILR